MPPAYHTLLAVWGLYMFALTMSILLRRVEDDQRVHDLPLGLDNHAIPKSLAWKLMTLPAIPSVLVFYAMAGGFQTHNLMSPQAVFIGLYCLHYLYRSLIYPQRLRTSRQRYSPVLVVLTWTYYIPMGYFMGTYFAQNDPIIAQLSLPVMLIGGLLFFSGLVSTILHDEWLIRLRHTPSQDYAIPTRGLFQYTSNAHYFSEFVEWTGFALMTMALPAFVHQVAVFALMLPQAIKTHTWYRNHFGTRYPTNRTSFFPFLF
ncbi:MAG: DUF1295 domain-containing protein [Myxococcota bacterium]